MAKTKALDQQLEIDLPDKKYFTIGEVSEYCQLKSHVLRYWEQVFPQLQPNKRRGRRYYQKRDVELVVEIKSLLHDQGFTISGAKIRLAKGDLIAEKVDVDAPQSIEHQLQLMRNELRTFQQYFTQRY